MARKKTVAAEPEQIAPEAAAPPEPTPFRPQREHFPIVGIGASAGGLAAFEAFFSGMPADKEPDMAFVLVQHLAPDHKSILTELIRRYTRMQVSEVEDGVMVQPNCAYIIPPNRDMAFLNGTLQLLEPSSPRGQRLPIDFFFRSLAQDQHERAICIVLSGTGSDGTQGLRAVKAEGGMVMAQNPESTEYDGMPRSAINTGLVDYILPAAEMPGHLIAYAAHAFGRIAHAQTPPIPKVEDAFKKIFILLRSQTGHDFSQYKQNTIKRRVERRMAVHQIAEIGGYVRFLQSTPVEVEALFRDLLIGVTSFFRDPEAFAALETTVIPGLFDDKPAGTPIRVWICGCSTGEEAYSIAILLQEQMEKLKKNFKLQLFATDIDSRAIDQARSGIYSASIAADVSAERLARFFTVENDGGSYRINKMIRDLLVFSEHDVNKDPTFSKLDLLSCRNLLIYLNADLQKKLIPLFHYSLNPGGTLFLGTSETTGDFLHLFSTIDRQQKLYQRKEDPSAVQLLPQGRFARTLTESGTIERHTAQTLGGGKISLRETTEKILLEKYAPTSILVSERGEILYVHGSTGRYLEIVTGEPGMNIRKMAREGLKRDLTTALHSTVKYKKPVERHGLKVKTNGDFSSVNLTILPVPPSGDSITDMTLYLVVLEEDKTTGQILSATDITGTLVEQPEEKSADRDALVIRLKQELRANEEYLQSANEELETSNEELKSSNEEMQSVNEELQSTNEELETSKEELQSVNEELATVNSELQTKVIDLSRANNDMNNLLAGTGVGTVFVDFKLLIQRFTPSITQIINLILSDVGRPVGHIVSNLVGYNTLTADITAVLDNLIPKEVEVQTKDGAWFLLRIRPYRTLDNVIEGAVITFFDISEIKRTREALHKANDLLRLAVVVRDAHDAIVLQDMEGRIMAWNPAAVRMYGWSETEALQMSIRELIPEGLRKADIERIRQLSRKNIIEPYRTQRVAKDGVVVEVWLTATALLNEAGDVYAVATSERTSGIE
ncbi:MAG TPA: PAS domain S-box protein [Desulfuromonadales bacterium]|nr:PAS domain S-box protein [Desulfuromonadales bacterium]